MEEDDDISPATSHLPDFSALMPLAQAAAEVGGGWNTCNVIASGCGGGREDWWSEAATAVLIDAWGERFLRRGNLKYEHWREVAEIVSMAGSGEYGKTDVQCKNRIDTVKKRYKQEKARNAAGGGTSSWVFFEKLDRLIGATENFPRSGRGRGRGESFQKVPMGIRTRSRSNLYQRQTEQQALVRRCSESTPRQFRSESESETSGDSEDSLPPPRMLPPEKRFKIDKTGGGREMTELARATLRFIEAYEKAETEKLKQTAEMEKERMKFLKEIESQRMQFLKAQMDIKQIELEIMKMKNR